MSKKTAFFELKTLTGHYLLLAVSSIAAVEELEDNIQRIVTISGKEFDVCSTATCQLSEHFDVISLE